MSFFEDLLSPVGQDEVVPNNKITVVGAGQVGMGVVISLLTRKVTNDVCMVDADAEKLNGEMMDLQHGCMYMDNANINASTDYEITAGSRLCIVTAGARQREGETRLSLLQRNADIIKSIIPKLVKHNPNTIIVMLSNPVDIMTYIAWKLSGFPKNRVIGTGCSLDSARFRLMISQRLGVLPTAVNAYIIGEHGDSSVPVWSSANVSGVRLRTLNPKIGTEEDEEQWDTIHKNVVGAAYQVIKLKGYTSWAVALCTMELCSNILNNTGNIIPISTAVKGLHGIEKDVFLSLPCVIRANGAVSIVNQDLDENELELLRKSADAVYEAQAQIKY